MAAIEIRPLEPKPIKKQKVQVTTKSQIEILMLEQKLHNELKVDDYTSSCHIAKPNVICCGVLELMQLGWMKLGDGRKCMPYIDGHSDENMYRVNNCPSCGKYVRDVIVEP